MFRYKKIVTLIVLALFIFINKPSNAQYAIETIDTIQYVNIFKDARLDILNTRAKLMADALAITKTKVEKPKESVPVYNPIKAGNKTVTGSIIQKNGFRVLIYNGADRNLAMKMKTEFNRKFPGMRSYMSYNVPNFKIKVGDFEDKKAATKFLKNITPFIPSASIVPDVVTVKNILVQ